MNDLDDFRAALRQPPDEPFAEPDLAKIMADGTRIRRRRRVLTSAAGVAAAAAVVLVVVFAVQLRQPAPAPVAQPPSPASVTPTTGATTGATPAERPIGDVVGTGIHTRRGEIVFFARAVELPELPDTHFGLVAGFRSGQALQSVLMTNEVRGSDRSFGFHATDGGELSGDEVIPVFGYFAGPAARITTTVHGQTVEASTAKWTEDPNVVIFWFDRAAVPNSAVLTPLIAYDAAGKRLTK